MRVSRCVSPSGTPRLAFCHLICLHVSYIPFIALEKACQKLLSFHLFKAVNSENLGFSYHLGSPSLSRSYLL